MKRIQLFLLALLLSVGQIVKAGNPDEGMWLPLLIKDLNYEEMKRQGCTLTAEQIYSVNHSSLKDAIVQLGNFCTAEVVSPEGLLLTNHHCAYDAIQEFSSPEHNYLKDGFWASNKGAELNVPGLKVSFLIQMEDVSDSMFDGTENMTGADRDAKLANNQAALIKKMEEENEGFRVEVKDMFDGNAYYAFIYEVFPDVRLVGAPPSSVGKYGGDTDNWMWPRHTGDFSMLRVYAGADNKPAAFSADNKPYKPKHFLPISVKGTSEGDYTMVMGYPGSTDRYLTSPEVANLKNNGAPTLIRLAGKRLEVMKKDMAADEEVFIKLASDYASLSNTHKYYQGQMLGLEKFDLIAEKLALEKNFMKWVNTDSVRIKKYGKVIENIEHEYATHKEALKQSNYLNLAGFAPAFIDNGIGMWRLSSHLSENKKPDPELVDKLKKNVASAFKDYVASTDEKVFAAMLTMMHEDLPEGLQPDVFNSRIFKKHGKGNTSAEKCAAFARYVFSRSIVVDQAKTEALLVRPKFKVLKKDPGVKYISSIISLYRKAMKTGMQQYRSGLAANRQLFVEGLFEMNPELKNTYPDANFTMRLTYGPVKSYKSWDGKPYQPYTYASQILDKYKPGDPEFDVPEKLRTLIKNKDYGAYAVDGKLPVCFIHTTDITGGNSGSPVINGEGHLVGVAFDGNWESMISDLKYDNSFVRTISVDSRYVLFIIDKYAEATHLLDEMTIIR